MSMTCVFGAAAYIFLTLITASVLPSVYADWTEYLADVPKLRGMISLPTFYAANELLGIPGLLFLGIAVFAAILSGIIGFYMAGSRLLYSMAQTGDLPAWFGKISRRGNTPVNAILFIMILSFVAPFFGRTALGWIVGMASIGAVAAHLYTSAAAIHFAREEKHTRYIVTGILGVVISIVFLCILLIPIPALDCSLRRETLICLLIWIAAGTGFRLLSRRKRSEKKIRT